jgi:hypothetical protein
LSVLFTTKAVVLLIFYEVGEWILGRSVLKMRRNCRQASTSVQISVETINIVVHVRMCKSVEAAKNDDYVLHVCGV